VLVLFAFYPAYAGSKIMRNSPGLSLIFSYSKKSVRQVCRLQWSDEQLPFSIIGINRLFGKWRMEKKRNITNASIKRKMELILVSSCSLTL
jgi:hypothetical protein